jgi:hypothetical protein
MVYSMRCESVNFTFLLGSDDVRLTLLKFFSLYPN